MDLGSAEGFEMLCIVVSPFFFRCPQPMGTPNPGLEVRGSRVCVSLPDHVPGVGGANAAPGDDPGSIFSAQSDKVLQESLSCKLK